MSKTVWLTTGAGRGMGTDIAKAALAAGHAVVATGRDPERVTAAIGAHDDLLAVKPTPIETSHPHSPMTTTDPFWVTRQMRAGKTTPRR